MNQNSFLRPAWMALILTAILVSPLTADFAVFRAPSRILSLFALPGETVPFDLATYAGVSPQFLSRYQIEASPEVEIALNAEGKGFVVSAPETVGIYPILFQERVGADMQPTLPYRVQVVVLRPAEEAKNGLLNGYPVGTYPRGDSVKEWQFEAPRGFVEITAENRNTLLSDNFTLADLDCKLQAAYPHYAVVQTSLLVKLEGITDELKKRELPGDHIRVLSGFRTPDYNRSIGNRTRFSRHIAGDAADIYIDADGDGKMDDLNSDGRIDRRDSRFLLAMVDQMDASSEYGPLVGGASAYRANSAHGPFLHVDTRGYPARW